MEFQKILTNQKQDQLYYLPINKNSIIDQISVTLLGDNNSTTDMTGGTSTTNMQKFSVTLLLQDTKD